MGSEKKRKRQEQNGERPTKKAAIAPAEGNVKVEYINNDDVPGPIIGIKSTLPTNLVSTSLT